MEWGWVSDVVKQCTTSVILQRVCDCLDNISYFQIQRLEQPDKNHWFDVAVVKGNSLVVSHHHAKPNSDDVSITPPSTILEA